MNPVEWAFTSLFLISGLLMLIGSARAVWRSCRSARWPQTTATVLSSELKSYESQGGENREDRVASWDVRVRYEYWVDGQRYEGTRIHPAYGASSRWSTHNRLSEILRPSQRVRVYYNARHPEECTLAAGFFSMSLAVVFAGWVFFSLGGGMLLHSWNMVSPVAILISIGVGIVPAFYFIIAGRGDFVRGIQTADPLTSKGKKRRARK